MALARVVSFDGVGPERMAEMKRNIEEGERPDDLPATEIMILHDAAAERALAIVFFDNEDDYTRGDAVLGAMPAGDVPGRRTSVDKYEVAVRSSS
jgi:hypothetical protein